MNPFGLLIFLLSYSKGALSTSVCSHPSGELSLWPESALISSTRSGRNKSLTLFVGNTDTFRVQCNDSFRDFNISNMSYSNGLNYERVKFPCGSGCTSDIMVLESNAIEMVNCTANHSRISCDTDGILDIVSPARSPGTTIKYSFYDTSVLSWVECTRYNADMQEIDELNNVEMYEKVVILCPFNESSQDSDSVLVRLEKDEYVDQVALGIRAFNFRRKRSPNYIYFTVKVSVPITDQINTPEEVTDGAGSTMGLIIGSSVCVISLVLILFLGF
ncbi:Fibroblast growth factor receptor 1Alike, partial [Caligus rogercresseyi]